MEYHAIEDSTSFAGIREILARKVKEGVEVRLLYDDVGSVGFISPEFIKRMEPTGSSAGYLTLWYPCFMCS